MAMELGNIAQHHKAINALVMITLFFLDHNAIKNIPADRKITHVHIVTDYWSQKPDPKWVRIEEKQQNLSLPKYFGTVFVCTPNAKYICANVKSFYLYTPMEGFEYMWMPIKHILQQTEDGFAHIEIRN